MVMKYGASVNYKDSRGFTPLILSILRKNYEIAYTLLELGANINIKDKNGNTALNYILIDFKLYQSPILYYDSFSEYILNGEISRRYLDLNTVNLYNYLDLLLSYGANINIKDNYDKSFKDYVNDIISILTNNKYKIEQYNKILAIFEIINEILNEPITYIDGCRRVDYALASPRILNHVLRMGYLPFYEPFPSDHRGYFVDLDLAGLFDRRLPTIVNPTSRILKAKIGRAHV